MLSDLYPILPQGFLVEILKVLVEIQEFLTILNNFHEFGNDF